ncbi:MAG: hypothetical protein ABWZ25_18605 [Chitinophagaceae bacterium]
MSSKKLKKEFELSVAANLVVIFASLTDHLTPKKFERNVKRATKALLAGFKEKNPKPKKTGGAKKQIVAEPVQ